MKIKRYRRRQDRQSALIGKLLLLEGMKGQGYSDICLDILELDNNGRPRIDERIDFNISHSDAGAVCVLTVNGRVGIDLERVKPIDLSDFRTWLTQKEWASITESGDPLREFYKMWTMKESVMKADGRGLSVSPLDIHLIGNTALLDGRRWFLNEINIDSNCMCHVASNLPCSEIPLIEKFF